MYPKATGTSPSKVAQSFQFIANRNQFEHELCVLTLGRRRGVGRGGGGLLLALPPSHKVFLIFFFPRR